jgi:hypothetical protein
MVHGVSVTVCQTPVRNSAPRGCGHGLPGRYLAGGGPPREPPDPFNDWSTVGKLGRSVGAAETCLWPLSWAGCSFSAGDGGLTWALSSISTGFD